MDRTPDNSPDRASSPAPPPDPPLEFDKPHDRLFHDFQQAGFTWGSMISRDWFLERLGFPPLAVGEGWPIDAVAPFMLFRKRLLKDKNMYLRRTDRREYQVVLPGKQTSTAIKDMGKGLSKLVRDTASIVRHVERSALTDEQWRENQETIGKLSFFRRKARKELL